MSADEIVRIEKSKIERFMALGLGRYEAIRAVEDALDLRMVAAPRHESEPSRKLT